MHHCLGVDGSHVTSSLGQLSLRVRVGIDIITDSWWWWLYCWTWLELSLLGEDGAGHCCHQVLMAEPGGGKGVSHIVVEQCSSAKLQDICTVCHV